MPNSVAKLSETTDEKCKADLCQLNVLASVAYMGFSWILVAGHCCETRGKESCAALEPASLLQNKAGKTNTGLKLDFPKHSIPSHFTHHCGLKTRIE